MRRLAVRVRSSVVLGAVLLGLVGSSEAQVGVAEQLYRDGQKLIAKGKTHEACLKFADSERADPALGTLIALAACHEREGKLASAWSDFTEAAQLAERQHEASRARYAREHARALEPKVHRVRFDVQGGASGVMVQIADRTFGEGALGSPIPLDAGDYAIEVQAPGKKPFSRTLHVDADAGGEERIIVELEDARPPPPTAPSPPPSAAPTTAVEAPPPSHGMRTTGLVVGGAGIVLGIVAGVLEARAASQSSQADDDARTANATGNASLYATAQGEHDDAVTMQRYAFFAGGVGLVALGVGVAMFVMGGAGPHAAATVGSQRLRFAPLGERGATGFSLEGAL